MTAFSSFAKSLLAIFFISQTTAFVAKSTLSTRHQVGDFRVSSSTANLAVANDGTVIDLLDSNFESLFHSEKPLLIDAYASFCGPCKLIEPVIQSCAQNWSHSLVVSRWNVEALQTDVKIELMLQGANPNKLPTLILVHRGKATKIHSGLIAEDQLDALLSEHLPLKTIERKPEPISELEKGEGEFNENPSQRKSGFINFGSNIADDYMLTLGQ